MKKFFSQFSNVFAYSRRAVELVWQTSSRFTLLLAILTVIAGLLPSAVAYIGQLLVDGVVAASESFNTVAEIPSILFVLLLIEGVLVMLMMASQRGISVLQSLFRALLGHRVNWLILQKAQTLSLRQFEDSEFYDKLVRARREASTRPLALVNKTFGLIQNTLALAGFSFLLFQFSPWVIVMLLVAALPGFFAEAIFSNQAFALFRWRSPEAREQNYLETLLAREDSAKEVKLFNLSQLLLKRYHRIFEKLYKEDRALTLRRDAWGWLMDMIANITFYGAYAWIIIETVKGQVSLGEMTMYLLVFKQGQSAITACLKAISGMYEDNLYLSNLYEYLEQPGEEVIGGVSAGTDYHDGVRFENVSFTYKGSDKPALKNISFHLKPGQSLAIVGENGSGKTTLIKLLTRLYTPSEGRILFNGTDITEWDGQALREQIGVIFQDFIRYQLIVGENIGVGQVGDIHDKARWQLAAEKGQAADFIADLSQQYHTQLGRWFKGGQELSGGQWQKMALARAFIRSQASLLILDEPTAAMDAQAEADIFNEFNKTLENKMAILISHRFSTVRTAGEIIVMDKGSIVESGTHEDLMAHNGVYARLFRLQAQGYQ